MKKIFFTALIMFITLGILNASEEKSSRTERRNKRVTAYLEENYAKKLEELESLREEDPETFKSQMQALRSKAAKEMSAKRITKNKKRNDNDINTVIWTKYSDEIARIRELKRENPEAFKSEMKAFRLKIGQEIRAEREKFRKMVIEYRKTKDPATLEAIKEYVSAVYDRSLEAAGKRLEVQRKKLEEAEEKLKERKEQKEKIINHKLKVFLKDPKLNW
jgi:adenylate kinase family enzyme